MLQSARANDEFPLNGSVCESQTQTMTFACEPLSIRKIISESGEIILAGYRRNTNRAQLEFPPFDFYHL